MGVNGLKVGILKKGFSINTPTITVKIPKGTIVTFHSSNPTIQFDGFPIKLMKIGNDWYADIYGALFIVSFNKQKPPYPISYFKS